MVLTRGHFLAEVDDAILAFANADHVDFSEFQCTTWGESRKDAADNIRYLQICDRS